MSKTQKRLTTYTRVKNPPPMRLTERDGWILEAIHAFDGMLADYQIQRLFFTGRRRMQERMSLLFQHGYVSRPNRRQRAAQPCMVYWLAKRGAEHVAGLSGLMVTEIGWRKKPRWIQLTHDLAINDFRLDVMEACDLVPELELEQWVPEGAFRVFRDRVEFQGVDGKRAVREVRPDSLFVIRSSNYRSRFLLEIDRAKEDNPRFVEEKVLPGLAYLRSESYERRFGHKSGRWLVVTTGEDRVANMKRQTEVAAGRDADVFYFTTFEQVTPEKVLINPIWEPAGSTEPVPLITLG